MPYCFFLTDILSKNSNDCYSYHSPGLILSGNEISQILLSVILAYIGGNSNRPRFISIGVVFCALSCFILAMPHLIYGAGEDALKLTKEFMDSSNVTVSINGI